MGHHRDYLVSQVARLVADDLSNKEIGARLFISEHTVDSHVRSILNELGCSSRAQIAAWMASRPRSGSRRRASATGPGREGVHPTEQDAPLGRDSGANHPITNPIDTGSRVPLLG